MQTCRAKLTRARPGALYLSRHAIVSSLRQTRSLLVPSLGLTLGRAHTPCCDGIASSCRELLQWRSS